ncbi:MAG: glycosyltransferase family 2 protein [Planctomycetaceae bacterium]|nr:glycosyltransferase family 2 protein [Planctomycetaceae bacterium]
MDLSVITATRQRPGSLLQCLGHYHSQSTGGLKTELIVVSDGPDRQTEFLARQPGVRYLATPSPGGKAGSLAKDLGLQHARGTYVCFWDDDNVYLPHALATLYAAAQDADIGVVRVHHRLRKTRGMVILPRQWSGKFVPGDVDTMCICVRTELAKQEPWFEEIPGPGTDIRWLKRLEAYQPLIRYVPVIIGTHC